jgi:branched-chain amino acid transport system substrate-binding protein
MQGASITYIGTGNQAFASVAHKESLSVMSTTRLPRRTVLGALATLALTACGGSVSGSAGSSSAAARAALTTSAPTTAATTASSSAATTAAVTTSAASTVSTAAASTSASTAATISAVTTSAAASTATASSASTSATASTAAAAASGTSIKIGAVYTTTGANAAYGLSQTNATKLAVDDLNKAGGINGAPLDVLYQDDAGDAKQALTVYQTLIQSDKVPAIIGPTLSSSAVSADPIAQQAKVAVLAVSNTGDGVVTIGDFIFRDSLSEAQVLPVTVKTVVDKLAVTKAAIIYGNDNAFTVSGYKAMKDALTKNNVQILTEETFASGDVDFSAQLTKIKGANPQAIFVSALLPEATRILDTARNKLQIPDTVHIVGGNGLNTPQLIKNVGKAAEGVIVGAAWNIASENPLSKTFVTAYKAKYNADPDQFAAQAYAGVTIMADALKRAGANPTGDAIRQALTTSKLPTVLGDFSFLSSRDANQAPVIQIITNGTFGIFS